MNQLYKTPPDYDTKARLHLGVSGRIVQWDDERGFGFVETEAIDEKIFFHANSIVSREHTPQVNERVTIHAKYDEHKKRWTASKLTSPLREKIHAKQQKEAEALICPQPHLKWALPVAVAWFLFLAWQAIWLAGIVMVLSLICIALYAHDKRAAIQGHHRIPEANLHLFALLGGWAGALVARYVFHHKTSKQPFTAIFWTTVVINVAIIVYLLHSGIMPF